jgi:hypothetical protein
MEVILKELPVLLSTASSLSLLYKCVTIVSRMIPMDCIRVVCSNGMLIIVELS